MSAPLWPSAFGRSFCSVKTVGLGIVGGASGAAGGGGIGGGVCGGVFALSCAPDVSVGVEGVSVPLASDDVTPGTEKSGGCAGVPVDVSPGTEVVPKPLSGGVPDPISCANVVSGERVNEAASTTANNSL